MTNPTWNRFSDAAMMRDMSKREQYDRATRPVLSEIIASAERKFGKVLETRSRSNDGFVLAILRDHPAIAERPYMTITAFSADNFCWGHYDLTTERMDEILKEVQ